MSSNISHKENLQVIPVYILGKVDQETYGMSLRANYNITPNLTLEFWDSHLYLLVNTVNFKRVHLPNAESYSKRFHLYENTQILF